MTPTNQTDPRGPTWHYLVLDPDAFPNTPPDHPMFKRVFRTNVAWVEVRTEAEPTWTRLPDTRPEALLSPGGCDWNNITREKAYDLSE